MLSVPDVTDRRTYPPTDIQGANGNGSNQEGVIALIQRWTVDVIVGGTNSELRIWSQNGDWQGPGADCLFRRPVEFSDSVGDDEVSDLRLHVARARTTLICELMDSRIADGRLADRLSLSAAPSGRIYVANS